MMFTRWLRGGVALAGALAVTILARPSAADPNNGAGDGVYGESAGNASADSLSGAMVYSYPFHLPVARGSVQPSLGLTYSSASRDGDAGFGWSLGLPVIERQQLSGWPKFNAEGKGPLGDDPGGEAAALERYAYNGRPLVRVCPNAGVGCAMDGAGPQYPFVETRS